jgi:hypothetical protein
MQGMPNGLLIQARSLPINVTAFTKHAVAVAAASGPISAMEM